MVITDNEEIKELNKAFRGIDEATNVLAFPMLEGDFSTINPTLLGDIVISAETADLEAKSCGITLEERLSQLLIHGILHLIGYDHEQGETEQSIMEQKSLELLRLIEKNDNLDAF